MCRQVESGQMDGGGGGTEKKLEALEEADKRLKQPTKNYGKKKRVGQRRREQDGEQSKGMSTSGKKNGKYADQLGGGRQKLKEKKLGKLKPGKNEKKGTNRSGP